MNGTGRLKDKIAVVTGGARGLGRSHALALAREGARVAVVDICRTPQESTYDMGRKSDLEQTARDIESIGVQSLPLVCNVADQDDVREMVRTVVEKWGHIDILVNNAGVISISSVVELKESQWDLVMDVNLKGTFLCCKYALLHMMRRKEGRIINTGSLAGRDAIPLNAHYGAAKAGVHLFTQALAKEVAPYGINVNAVAPGGVNTAMMERAIAPALAALWSIAEAEAYRAFCERFNVSAREVTEQDISSVVVWLALEETRNLTGVIVYV